MIDEELLNNLSYSVKYIFHDAHFFDLNIATHPHYKDFFQLPSSVFEKIIFMHYHELCDIPENIKIGKPTQKFFL